MSEQNEFPLRESPEFWEAWKSAERALKEVELATGQHCSPAVNELRYASTHLQRALSGEADSQSQEIWKGIRHCNRAEYDCFEYACLHFLKEFDKFEELWCDYMDFVSDVIPDYVKIRVVVLEARSHLSEVDRSENGDRGKFSQAAREKMKILQTVSQTINHARPAVLAKARRDKRSTRFQILLVILSAVLSTALAVVFLNQ